MATSQGTSAASRSILFTLASLHFTTQHLGHATWIASPCQQFRGNEQDRSHTSSFSSTVLIPDSCSLQKSKELLLYS